MRKQGTALQIKKLQMVNRVFVSFFSPKKKKIPLMFGFCIVGALEEDRHLFSTLIKILGWSLIGMVLQ